MALTFFNTLTREKEEFKPLKRGKVGMYTCGPTVYNYVHIGNLRAYVWEDLLRRYLKYKGYKITHVMNFTDVDDKTIKGSQAEKVALQQYTAKFKKAFMDDIDILNIEHAEYYPEATAHVAEMIELVKILLKKKYAYRGKDGCIYYDISKFKKYGKLSHFDISELKAGARVKQDEYEKETAADFALWKAWDASDGEVFWLDDELGKGRPGWHIECSAMSMKYLGETFDIHTGGVDNMFPHHENEIAQSEAATGKKFVNYWLHCEHLIVNGKKMSKSLGNFYTLRDLLSQNKDPRAIRFAFLSTHYRQQLNFTFDQLGAADSTIERLDNFMVRLMNSKGEKDNTTKVKKLIKEATTKFEESMDDDLNISPALGAIFELILAANKLDLSPKDAELLLEAMHRFDTVLGLLHTEEMVLEDEIQELIDEREAARKRKDWARADEIRNKLENAGIVLEDTPKGVRWKKKK